MDYFWKLLNLVLVATLIGIVFIVLPAIKNYSDSLVSASTISASSEGKTLVSPDTAEIDLSVVSRGKNPTDLADTNNTKMSAVIDNLKSQGIDSKDIKTTTYNLNPDYAYDENTRRSYITGYTMTQTVTVKVRDLAKVASVLAGVTPLGVNQIGSVRYTIENQDAALQTARDEAISKAKAKAKGMASASGGRLGRLLNIYESQSGPIPYYYSTKEAFGMGGGPVAAPTVEPGQQEVKVQVSLTYELN